MREMKKKGIAIILIFQILFNIIFSNSIFVFAVTTIKEFHTPECFPADKNKTYRITIPRFTAAGLEDTFDVMFGSGADCQKINTLNTVRETSIKLYKGGSYNFKYFINACNRVQTYAWIEIIDENGNEEARWDSPRYGRSNPDRKIFKTTRN